MGAFGSNHIDFTKGWPSMNVVDLAIPVNSGHTDILEGMCISENANGEWVKGCPQGKIPYVTGSEQFPTALDVSRTQDTTVGEMGAKNMGGISLTNQLEFATTAYAGDIAGKTVYGDTDGLFKPVTDLSVQQIAGYCRNVSTDADGDSVALIVAAPVLNPLGVGDVLEDVSSSSSSGV